MDKLPFSTEKGDIFTRLVERSRYSALSEDERLEYDRWRKAENDYLLHMQWKKEEGKTEREWEIAETMIEDGLPLEKVSRYSGIPLSELQSKFG